MNEDRPLFIDQSSKAYKLASRLMNQGYRKISNNHRLVSRIERKDWAMYMATKHAPWDPDGEGIQWVVGMGMMAEDHYRRCYSPDRKTVSPEVIKHIPSSNHTCIGFRPIKGESKVNHDVDPYDMQDKWKIHSMNVITGKSQSSSNKFYDTFDEALERSKSIVCRDPDVVMVILKCTHVVKSMCPPIEVVDLENMEHSDA